jgi:hypothetical protein
VARGASIGVSWEEELRALRGVDWEAARAGVEDKALRYPDYYIVRRFAFARRVHACLPARVRACAAR